MLHIAEAIILQAPGTEVVFLPLEAEVYARGSAVGDIPRMLVSTSTLESAQQSRWVSQVTQLSTHDGNSALKANIWFRKRVSRQLGFTGQLGRQRSASSHSTEQDPDSHEAAQTKGRHRRNCRGLIGPDYAVRFYESHCPCLLRYALSGKMFLHVATADEHVQQSTCSCV